MMPAIEATSHSQGTGEGPTGWTGLCIEPHPDALAIVAKHRKCKVASVSLYIRAFLPRGLSTASSFYHLQAIQLALSDTEGTAKFSTDTLQVMHLCT